MDFVHKTKWVPSAISLEDLWDDGFGGSSVGLQMIPPSEMPGPVASTLEAFDGKTFELTGMTAPGAATLRDFYGVNVGTGQLEISLPTGIRFAGVNGDDFELKINIHSGVQRNGGTGRFTAWNYEDYLLIRKTIPLGMEVDCDSEHYTQIWSVRELVNSSPFIQRMKGGSLQTWTNVGMPYRATESGLILFGPTTNPYFPGTTQDLWPIPLKNMSSCKYAQLDGIVKDSSTSQDRPMFYPNVPNEGKAAGIAFSVGDAALVEKVEPPPNAFYKFVPQPGILERLDWNCHVIVIEDAQGTKWVYSGFRPVRQIVKCMTQQELPHGGSTSNVPNTQFVPEGNKVAEITLQALCIYRETRDGLRMYHLYNKYGQLVGFRDPAGREVGFKYGSYLNPLTGNTVSLIRDEFGRQCGIEMDGGDFKGLVLDDLAANEGASGQPAASRPIKVDMEVVAFTDLRPGQTSPRSPTDPSEVERVYLKSVKVGTPRDVEDGIYSFEANLEVYGDQPFQAARVASVRASSDRMPDGLSPGTAGGVTTYAYTGMTVDTCSAEYTVLETLPDGSTILHTFDEFSNPVRIEEQTAYGSGAVATTEYRYGTLGGDVLNMTTGTKHPEGDFEYQEYQFEVDGGLPYYYSHILGEISGPGFFFKHNVLTEGHRDQETGGALDLFTTYTYGLYQQVKSKRPPLPYGTDSTGYEFEHTFDDEVQGYPLPLRGVIVETRRPNVDVNGVTYTEDELKETFTYNKYGQLLESTRTNSKNAEGSPTVETTSYVRHALNDPDGDGTVEWKSNYPPPDLPGYVHQEIVEGAGPGGTNIVTDHRYDEYGREVLTTDGRENQTLTRYNVMDQAWQTTKGELALDPNAGVGNWNPSPPQDMGLS